MRNTRKGFTLIELMIVIAIIAIIAAIAIPGILSARRSANANAAMGNLKSFCTAMATFSNDQADQTYPAAVANFGSYYSHLATKGGYSYSYYTTAAKSQYVYAAWPTSMNNGTKVYVVDESNRIWEGEANANTVTATVHADTNWATENGPERFTWAGVTGTWTLKS